MYMPKIRTGLSKKTYYCPNPTNSVGHCREGVRPGLLSVIFCQGIKGALARVPKAGSSMSRSAEIGGTIRAQDTW